MKSIRKFSKITIVLVAVFMVIALFRYREYDDTPLVPEQLEYYFDEGWLMYSSYSAEKVAVTRLRRLFLRIHCQKNTLI